MPGSQPITAPFWGFAPHNPLRSVRRAIRRQPLLRRARRALFALCVHLLLGLVRSAPRSWVIAAMDRLAAASWHILPRERWVARRQLEGAFPALDPSSRDALARSALSRLAENLVDCVRDDRGVWMAKPDEERLLALASAGRPLLLLCAHQGAWELLGVELARRLPSFAVITAEPHNATVGRILRESRQSRGLQVFDRDREALAAARFLRRGGTLALLADHRSRASSVRAPWFGRPAPTLRAPEFFARRCGAALLAVGIRRDGAGHRIVLGRSPQWRGQSSAEFAGECNQAIEEMILASPTEWTWFHDRWGGEEAERP